MRIQLKLLDNITKFPVFVIASPRTGSTAVLRYISEKYDLAWYNEIHSGHNLDLESYNLISNPANTDWYVCKFFALDYKKHYSWINKKDCFIIKLRRRNVLEQIFSHYAATVTDRFIYYDHPTQNNIQIPVNIDQIKVSINTILEHNYFINTFRLRADLDLYYEDLGLLKNSKTFLGPEIDNKDEITNLIIEEYNKCHREF